MDCSFPPELSDSDLLAYLDGQADRAVEEHLNACGHCRERAAALAAQESRLLGQLYRSHCPDAQALGEYHLGMLDRGDATAVAQHIERCPHCAQELAQLRNYLTELQPEIARGPLSELRILVAELVSGGRRGPSGVLAPAMPGVRGAGDGPMIYRAEEVQLALVAEEDDEHPGGLILAGLVTGVEARGFDARLLREGEPVSRTQVDASGNFGMSDLQPGAYDLRLSGPGLEIQVSDLEI